MTVTAHTASGIREKLPIQSVTSLPLKAVYTAALTVAFACIAFSIPMTLAGIASSHAERGLQQWARSESPPSPAYWQKTLERAERGARLYPVSNGEYFDRLGRVQAWGPIVHAEESAEGYARAALPAFRKSVDSRPSWPWTWLRVAYAKQVLQEIDQEFNHAMAEAELSGPGRSDVNDELARLGLASWEHLDRDQRAMTLAAAGRAVANSTAQAQDIYETALALGLDTPLCWTLSNEIKTVQRICKETGSQ